MFAGPDGGTLGSTLHRFDAAAQQWLGKLELARLTALATQATPDKRGKKATPKKPGYGASPASSDSPAPATRGAEDDLPPGSGPAVGDALALNDKSTEALRKLAVRIALAVARPGTGDAILIFVAGMADIDALVETFQEMAPDKVAAPVAKLATDAMDAEDADLTEDVAEVTREARAARREVLEGEDTADEEEGDDGAEVESGDQAASVAAGGKKQLSKASSARIPNPTAAPAARATQTTVSAPAAAADKSTIRLLPMHSLISFDDQMAAFKTGEEEGEVRV